MNELGRRTVARMMTLACLTCLIVVPVGAQKSSESYLLLKLCPGAQRDVPPALLTDSVLRWTPLGVPGWVRVAVREQNLVQVRTDLAREPCVLAVEQDGRVHAALAPNDAHWDEQWGPAKINAPYAWEVTAGRPDVLIAVLDTGVDLAHDDLIGQVWVNPGEVPDNHVDDDGNGKVDDMHGWRFCHDASEDPDESSDVMDDHGHGTHVGGIIAALGNNELGVAGMAWRCRLMILKVLDSSGDGWYSDVAAGLVYAVDNGARIANLSLGGSEDHQVLQDAVDYAHEHGVLVVVAAGNGYYPNDAVLYPAAYDHALAIVASDAQDQRAGYSCYGPEVDLAAPGSSIYSTCLGGGYCFKSGTSMAAPHVAGLAALIWSYWPEYALQDIVQAMTENARDIERSGWDSYTGWGRVDADPVFWTRYYFPFAAFSSSVPRTWQRDP